ncbi:MAG: histidine kinase [Pseudonocardiales bacterium]
MVRIKRWRTGRSGAQTIDLFTRAPLYVVSASEPLVALLVLGAAPHARAGGAIALLTLAVAHAAVCVALLHAGIAHLLGGPRPRLPLIGSAVALTVAGLAAGAAAFPTYFVANTGHQGATPAALAVVTLFCGALTVALTPLLRSPALIGLVALPAVGLGIVQAAGKNSHGQPLWAIEYALWVGVGVATYRPSLWYLGIVWQLDRSQAVQARLAVAEERLRFARDLHDVLGRNLTLIAINSELAAQLARRGQDGAVEHMLDVRQTAEDSMREVRAVVDGYRTTDLDAELAGARSVLRAAGIGARVVGDGRELSRTAQAALGWVVREAATNIIRHSEATKVKIELDVVQFAGAPTAELRIENDGVRPTDSGVGAGTGLVGLRERLAALGGDVIAEAGPGDRFVVTARVPLTAESPAPTRVEQLR